MRGALLDGRGLEGGVLVGVVSGGTWTGRSLRPEICGERPPLVGEAGELRGGGASERLLRAWLHLPPPACG